MANSGYKDYSKLEMYYVGDGASTGKTKNNIYGQPDYVSTVWDIEACPLPDTTPPSIPEALWLISSTPTSLVVGWNASTDNIGVDHYNVSLVYVGDYSTNDNWYEFTGLMPNLNYEVRVWAVDATGNLSTTYAVLYTSTPEDINTTITFQWYWNTWYASGGYKYCEIQSDYDELNFVCSESWVQLSPSATSGNLILSVYTEYNWDGYTRESTVYVYHGTTYVGSINIEQTS